MNTRNFWFLNPPDPDERRGRYVVGDTDLLLGTPGVAAASLDANGQREVSKEASAVVPYPSKHGIVWQEPPFSNIPGTDPVLFAQGDFDTAKVGSPIQLISGRGTRFRLKNTADDNFEFQHEYLGRTIVAGLGATPTLAIDDLIMPGPGNSSGYWQEADNATHAWAIVVAVYDTQELDAELLF